MVHFVSLTSQRAKSKNVHLAVIFGNYILYAQKLPYFLEFFPRVQLISECANMQVQFKGRNQGRSQDFFEGSADMCAQKIGHAHL